MVNFRNIAVTIILMLSLEIIVGFTQSSITISDQTNSSASICVKIYAGRIGDGLTVDLNYDFVEGSKRKHIVCTYNIHD